MKNATLLLIALFTLGAVYVAFPGEAAAQGWTRHTRTNTKKTTTKRVQTERRTHHSKRSHRHRHHTHRHHRSGVHVRFGVGTGYHHHRHHYYHRPHYYRHDRTVVVREPTRVIVVEREPRFVMPELDCPTRTDEVRVGLQQWCETPRGNKHGTYRRWYDDGYLAAEGEYEYDFREGVWTEWHPNGAIREEGQYDGGERSGTWVTWGADGDELVVVEY